MWFKKMTVVDLIFSNFTNAISKSCYGAMIWWNRNVYNNGPAAFYDGYERLNQRNQIKKLNDLLRSFQNIFQWQTTWI